MPFASGLLNQCYRLFFNNTEEVKQFLLDEREGRRKPSFSARGAGWVGLYRARCSLKVGAVGSANARSLSEAVLSVMGSSD